MQVQFRIKRGGMRRRFKFHSGAGAIFGKFVEKPLIGDDLRSIEMPTLKEPTVCLCGFFFT
jgi:hypothetical protein